MCHFTCITVFQPTEIRTSTGSVSYPRKWPKTKERKEEWNLAERKDQQGLQRPSRVTLLGLLRQFMERWREQRTLLQLSNIQAALIVACYEGLSCWQRKTGCWRVCCFLTGSGLLPVQAGLAHANTTHLSTCPPTSPLYPGSELSDRLVPHFLSHGKVPSSLAAEGRRTPSLSTHQHWPRCMPLEERHWVK